MIKQREKPDDDADHDLDDAEAAVSHRVGPWHATIRERAHGQLRPRTDEIV